MRPKDASGFDGEDILVIRDDAFGNGFVFAALPEQEITGMIDGRDLADPVDAVLTKNTGRILMLKAGLMRYEVLPGFEVEQPRPASIWSIFNVGGEICLAASRGGVFQRCATGDWRLLTDGLKSGPFGADVGKMIFGGVGGFDGAMMAIGGAERFRGSAG